MFTLPARFRPRAAARFIAIAAVAASSLFAVSVTPAFAAASAATASEAAKTLDRITLKDGTVVEGTIISETEQEIRINQVFKVGSIEQTIPRSYAKSEIEKIERGVSTEGGSEAGSGGEKNDTDDAATKTDAASGPSVYFVTLTGEFGLDLNVTPIEEILNDARDHQPDILVIKVDATFSHYGEERNDFWFDSDDFMDKYWDVQKVHSLFFNAIPHDPLWKKQPRIVFWVEKAMGGATLLPFASPEIYFTPDGRMGGAGPADLYWRGFAHDRVRQKWLDMVVTPMEGALLRNGYAYQLVRAMAYSRYVLSYKLVGGKPVFFEGFPTEAPEEGYVLLVDDGNPDAGRQDTMEQILRFQGNDWLVLDAELALRLGVSKGTVSTLDDLMYALGVTGKYNKLEDTRGDRIIEDWRKDVQRAEQDLRRLLNDYRRVQVGGDYKERTRARGLQIRLLRQMQSLMTRFGESINPAQWGQEAQFIGQLDVMISRIQRAQRLDQPD